MYNRKLNRPVKKFIHNVKWMHYSKRFEIFRNANDKVNDIRLESEWIFQGFFETYRSVITEYLVREEKNDQGWSYFLSELFSLTEDELYPSLGNIKNYPPILATTRPEIMNYLEILAKKYKAEWTGTQNVQSFLYIISNTFKLIFENQNNVFPSAANDPVSLSGGGRSSESDIGISQAFGGAGGNSHDEV